MATTLTQADDDRIKSYQKQYAERRAAGASQGELSDIHHAAEAIRNGYGYSGGDDGSGYVPLSDTMANTSSTSSNPTATATQNNYLNQLYAAKQTAALNSLKSAYEQNVSSLNASAAKIPETYRTARNQTAATSAQNQVAFDERAAANGINSGTGSQAALAIGNTLTNNLTNLNKQEASNLADIETQKSNLAAQYQSQIASAVSNNNIALAQSLYEESVRAQNQALAQQQYETEQRTSKDTTDYNKQLTQAKTLAAYGDFSGYSALGYTPAQIANMESAYLQSKAKTSSGGSYSGGGGKPKLTAAQALAAYNDAGIRTPEVVAAYTYYYGDPDYDPTKTPTYSTPRTATYGNSTVSEVNERINAGYTPQEVMAAAKEKYGVNSNEYKNIVSAVLRR